MSSSHEIKPADSDRTEILVFDLRSTTDVRPSDDDHRDTAETFRALHEAKLQPRFISEERCLKAERRGAIYVFSVFRGRAFESLKQRGCRVYGTPIVMQCILEIDRLPKVDYPVFSKTLVGARICCTGLEARERERIGELVKWMHGKFSGNFTVNVTHLISDECNTGSEKYITAIRGNIPVVQRAWIDEAWKQAHDNRCRVLMTFDDVIAKFKTPIFANLGMTVSGMATDKRKEMIRLIEEHGGEFSGEMNRHRCTHLVTDEDSGAKAARAKQWGTVKIVTSKWIIKSTRQGYRLDERKFYPGFVERGPLSSTQVETAQPISDPDISAIPGGVKNFCKTNSTMTNASILSATTVSRVAETATSMIIRRDNIPDHSQRENLVQKHRRYSSRPDPIEQLDISALGNFNNCLAGSGIILCGIADQNTRDWRRVLNITGAAHRLIKDINSPNITHIVLGPSPVEESLLQAVKKRSATVPVVTPDWLLECAQLRMRVPRTPFMHPMFDNDKTRSSFVFDKTGAESRVSVANIKQGSIPEAEKENTNTENRILPAAELVLKSSEPYPVMQAPEPEPEPEPIPVFEEPEPAPVPVFEEPEPAPVPVFEEPEPAPVPVFEEPEPAPVPVFEEPEPAPVPVFEKPEPAPVPVFEEPEYEPAPATFVIQRPEPQETVPERQTLLTIVKEDPEEQQEHRGSDQTVGEASFRISTLLEGRTFRILFADAEEEKLPEQIMANGGVLLPVEDHRIADYCMCSQLLTDVEFVDAKKERVLEVVSWTWFTKILIDEQFCDPSVNPLFRPISAVGIRRTFFAGCVVAIAYAGFDPAIYAELKKILTDYGALVQNDLNSRDTTKGKRNTHLIVAVGGRKVEFAKKHGIPVVDAAWVAESIIHKRRLPADRFPFEGEPFKNYKRTDQAFMRAQKVDVVKRDEPMRMRTAIPADAPVVTKCDIPVARELVKEELPSAQQMNQDEDQHVDVEYISPAQHCEQFEALQPMEQGHVDDDFVSFQSFDDNYIPAAQAMDESAVSAAQRIVDEDESFIPAAQPVEEQIDQDLNDLCFDEHGAADDETEERDPGLELINDAAKNCDQNAERAQEALPRSDTYQIQATPLTQYAPNSQELLDTCDNRMQAIDAAMLRFERLSNARSLLALNPRSLEEKKTTDAENHDKQPSVKRSSHPQLNNCPESSKLTQTQRRNPETQTQSMLVGWDDRGFGVDAVCSYPEHFATQQQLLSMKDLKKQSVEIVGSVGAQNDVHNSPEVHEPAPALEPEREPEPEAEPVYEEEAPMEIEEEVPMQMEEETPQPRRVFFLTGMSRDDGIKQRCLDIIEQLGGELDPQDGHGEATHLITPSVTRSEKILSAVARGLWIVTPEFLFDSQEAGHFIDESNYEHGHCGQVYKGEVEQKLAEACRRWRIKLKDNPELPRGAFSKWNVAVYGGSKSESVIRLIRLGGGVARHKSELGNSFKGANRVLTDSSKGFDPTDLRRLVRWHIPLFKIEFTATALMEYPLVEQNYYVPDYRTLLDSNMVL